MTVPKTVALPLGDAPNELSLVPRLADLKPLHALDDGVTGGWRPRPDGPQRRALAQGGQQTPGEPLARTAAEPQAGMMGDAQPGSGGLIGAG